MNALLVFVREESAPLLRMGLSHADELVARVDHRVRRDPEQSGPLVDRLYFRPYVSGRRRRLEFRQTL